MNNLKDIHFGRIEKRQMRRVKTVFFVGIGGVGMSAIAEVLLNLGYRILGSDLKPSINTKRLEEMGAQIFYGHHGDNIVEADVVVTSSAISQTNPEVVQAYADGVPVIRRAEMLAELMRFRFGIAVAGTHGKTTTTSLISSVLADAGLDPTFVIGGVLTAVGSNARLGEGQYLVAEADESDASFLHLQPMISVITNIDADHLETYDGSLDKLKGAFLQFLHNLPFYGLAIVCADDLGVQAIIPKIARPMLTYGFTEKADIRAVNVRQEGLLMRFDIVHKNGESMPMALNMPGKHNVLNALAAYAVARELGVGLSSIADGLVQFKGVGRRFTYHGSIWHQNGQADIFEDYGHHPSEIEAVLAAASEGFGERRVMAVFQPHRYTRTRDLLDDFARVLSHCDGLVLLDIYPAGETAIEGIDTRALARAIRAYNRVEPVYISNKATLNQQLHDHLLQDEDVVIYFGAGDIGRLAKEMSEKYQQQDK